MKQPSRLHGLHVTCLLHRVVGATCCATIHPVCCDINIVYLHSHYHSLHPFHTSNYHGPTAPGWCLISHSPKKLHRPVMPTIEAFSTSCQVTADLPWSNGAPQFDVFFSLESSPQKRHLGSIGVPRYMCRMHHRYCTIIKDVIRNSRSQNSPGRPIESLLVVWLLVTKLLPYMIVYT